MVAAWWRFWVSGHICGRRGGSQGEPAFLSYLIFSVPTMPCTMSLDLSPESLPNGVPTVAQTRGFLVYCSVMPIRSSCQADQCEFRLSHAATLYYNTHRHRLINLRRDP